jgi:hypothetical protein
MHVNLPHVPDFFEHAPLQQVSVGLQDAPSGKQAAPSVHFPAAHVAPEQHSGPSG